jgi:transketolase
MAIAEKALAARFNRPGHSVVDHYTYAICSDGDLMEGVSGEAASLAGHLGLGKLIALYDDNHISIDGRTDIAFTEDRLARFKAYGWHVSQVDDGTDILAIEQAIEAARAETTSPSFIAIRTYIGHGSPNKQDSPSAHGEPLGVDEVRLTKEAAGWRRDPAFYVPPEALTHFRKLLDRGRKWHGQWRERFEAYRAEHPDLAGEFERRMARELPVGWSGRLPVFTVADGAMATREAGGKVMNALAEALPELMGGSADLSPSTKTLLVGSPDFSAATPAGRNIRFGVREHAMGAIVNGMAYHGGFIPYGSTFLIFSDYMRPPIRLAALSHLHVVHVFTHDSVALGEDGPTHQPVEHLLALRAIPNTLVLRPADPNETSASWQIALEHRSGPVMIALTRQKVPTLDPAEYPQVAEGALRGGYTLKDAEASADIILLATGSEVHVALAAAAELSRDGVGVRVVSMMCEEIFVAQPEEYRASVLPEGVPLVVVEAGTTLGWRTYLGDGPTVVGIDRFGASAPGDVVMERLGITAEAVVSAAYRTLGRSAL